MEVIILRQNYCGISCGLCTAAGVPITAGGACTADANVKLVSLFLNCLLVSINNTLKSRFTCVQKRSSPIRIMDQGLKKKFKNNYSCATWKANGFCLNAAYSAATIQAYCCASCAYVAFPVSARNNLARRVSPHPYLRYYR